MKRITFLLMALVAMSVQAAPSKHPSWEIRPIFAARVAGMPHDAHFVTKCLKQARTAAEIEFCWSYQD